MSGPIKGCAFILNNCEFEEDTHLEQRRGSEIDMMNMKQLTKEMGYHVTSHENRTAEVNKMKSWRYAFVEKSVPWPSWMEVTRK